MARFLKGFIVNKGAITAQGDRLSEYIQAQQNANGDLSRWSVALVSPASAKTRLQTFGGQANVGLPIRVPQPEVINNKAVVPFREQDEKIYCLRQRNVITPSDSWIDLEDELLTDAYIEALLRKDCFGGKNEEEKIRAKAERDILQEHTGKLVTDVGRALTKHRANLKKPGSGDTIKEISGRVMRELRLQSNGLLLLYPLDPTGGTDENGVIRLKNIDPAIKSIIGFAVSFPVAENAIPIEYQVNEVFRANQNDSLWAEADFEEDVMEEFGWMAQ